MVAEDHVHLRVILFVAVNVIELFDAAVRQASVAVAMEVGAEQTAEYAFVSSQPIDAETAGNTEHLFRNASLRRPCALRLRAEDAFVERDAALDLLTRGPRMLEALR